MMKKTAIKQANGSTLYKCVVCGKEAKSSHLKHHIEANHLEGISVPAISARKHSVQDTGCKSIKVLTIRATDMEMIS